MPRSKFDRLVWAAYGNTHNDGRYKMRPAPSAGATYPVEIYMVLENVETFRSGIYKYDTKVEKPILKREGDFLASIRDISWEQDFIALSNVAFLFVYNPSKIIKKYGRDSRKYAILECGHIAQNLLLMAAQLGMASVPVGAFSIGKMRRILEISDSKEPIYMICVGFEE